MDRNTSRSYRRRANSNKESVKEKMDKLERTYIKISTSVMFSLGYFFLSRLFLNWVSNKYFPESEMNFQWYILDFVKENQE